MLATRRAGQTLFGPKNVRSGTRPLGVRCGSEEFRPGSLGGSRSRLVRTHSAKLMAVDKAAPEQAPMLACLT